MERRVDHRAAEGGSPLYMGGWQSPLGYVATPSPSSSDAGGLGECVDGAGCRSSPLSPVWERAAKRIRSEAEGAEGGATSLGRPAATLVHEPQSEVSCL